MISEQAIKRTIERLSKRKDFERYGAVVVSLRVLLEEQGKIEDEHERQHNEIINSLGHY